MRNVTVRLPEDLINGLDAEADETDVLRSEYICRVLRERHEADELRERVAELEDRLEAREDRIEQLEDQLARRSQLEDS